MRIQFVESNRQNMYLPRKFLPLVRCILQRPPFFARKNGRIGTASDSLILLNTKTLSIKHAYTTKTVLFLTCKRHYNNDVRCYQDSTFVSNAQWRRPLFFSEWLIGLSWKPKDFLNRCFINFVLPIMQLKHVNDPSLVKSNERRCRNPIKVHQLLFLTLSHIKPSFHQIFCHLLK